MRIPMDMCAHGKLLREPCIACEKLDRAQENLRALVADLSHEASRLRGRLARARQASTIEEVREVLGDEPEREHGIMVVEETGERLSRLVLDAVIATFKKSGLSPLSHYQDHVRSRWAMNLRRALHDIDDFIHTG